MKRIIAALIALITVFTLFASCGSKEFDADKYISESLLVAFKLLVNSNQDFYNNVFVLGHLKVDEKKAFEKDGKKYAPVVDKKYASYQALVDSLKITYTEDCVSRILADYPVYSDIDGVFCYNLTDGKIVTEGRKWVLDPEKKPELEGKGADYYIVEYRFTEGKHDELDEFKFVRSGTQYRLDELQYVD